MSEAEVEGEGLVWMLPEIEGELSMDWTQRYSHALTFRFYSLQDGFDGDWVIQANVKWDGCINWETSPDCMYHFCGPEDSLRLHRAFVRAWEFTRDNLDVADPICFRSEGNQS